MPKLGLWLSLAFLLTIDAGTLKAEHEIKTGTTLVCGSAADAKQFLATNENLQQALTDNDDGSKADSACLLAPIAYIAGKGMDRVEHSAGTFIVTEILIVGVGTPVGVLAIKPAVVYTVLPVPEEAA
jgi:hypothetical protein